MITWILMFVGSLPVALFPEVSVEELLRGQAQPGSSSSPAERYSGAHIQRLVESAVYLLPLLPHLNTAQKQKAFLQGIIDSDQGKWSEYKTYFTQPDFIRCIRGTPEEIPSANLRSSCIRALVILNDTMLLSSEDNKSSIKSANQNGKRIAWISKNTPLDQDLGILKNYLHDLPGMWAAVQEFSRISNPTREQQEAFVIRLRTNLFHNGPHSGFWKKFSEVIMPMFSQTQYLKGTVFDPSGTGQIYYPYPLSVEFVAHNLLDRIDQGSPGGMIKIFFELQGNSLEFTQSSRVLRHFLESVYENSIMTQDQIHWILNRLTNQNDTRYKDFVRIAQGFSQKLNRQISQLEHGLLIELDNGDIVSPERWRTNFRTATVRSVSIQGRPFEINANTIESAVDTAVLGSTNRQSPR